MTALLRFDGVALRRGGRLLFEGLDLTLGAGERLQVTGPIGDSVSAEMGWIDGETAIIESA